jgi:hypothetical protein
MVLPIPSLSCCISKQLIFCKEKKALAFNWDRWCHLALFFWLILFRLFYLPSLGYSSIDYHCRKSLLKKRLRTIDLLVLTSLVKLLLIQQTIFFYKTSYHNEEFNCTEPSRSVSVPWPLFNIHLRWKTALLLFFKHGL